VVSTRLGVCGEMMPLKITETLGDNCIGSELVILGRIGTFVFSYL